MSDTFVTAQVFPGKTNALVKNMMKAMGLNDPNEAVDAFNCGKWQLTKVASGKVTPIVQAVEALLEDMESVTVVIDTTVDPTKVLKTDNTTIKAFSLWVDDNFAKILAKAKGNVPTSVTIKPRRLKNGSNDRKIKDALPKDHEVDPTEFVYMLATELKKVRAGKQSSVLAKDRRRLFYVAGFVVSVYIYLNFGISEWYVIVSKLDDNKCRAEDILFSCN